jgi:hypothetical protein
MWIAAVLSCLAPLAPVQTGHVGECPDVRACDVQATITEEGHAVRCGIGIELFGLRLGLGGPECYPRRFRYPAHQECHGKLNIGTYCAYEQNLPVVEERCECSSLALLGTGIALPSCNCTTVGNAGTIEDFGTANCVPGLGHGGHPPEPSAGGAPL